MVKKKVDSRQVFQNLTLGRGKCVSGLVTAQQPRWGCINIPIIERRVME
ncbi:MAG: hypothetical protein OEZ25_08440 [Candidatus Bathyarchaeota archaeon]|nr:hypothetical protein [Candidatus Bathyarchaeota archaeon]